MLDMALQEHEEEVIHYLGGELHQNTLYYKGLMLTFMEYDDMLKNILNEAQTMRTKGLLSKETYQTCKTVIRNALLKKEEEEKLGRFLQEPQNEIECLLVKKKGIKQAKVSSGRIYLVFDDGEELDVQYEDHVGMNISLGKFLHTEKDGL